MAKSELRLKARELRKKGVSVKTIAKVLGVSKSMTRIWVRDIILTVEQLEILTQNSIKGAALGRLKSALLQKNRRLDLIERSKNEGIIKIATINKRELLLMGLALYWAEGSRKTRRVDFCNSDPKMINIMIIWLEKCFGVKKSELSCRIDINQAHRLRDGIIKEYWSRVTNLPLDQFRNTSFKRVANTKVYDNFDDHYGTFRILVKNPARLFYKIIGLIEGLREQDFKERPPSGNISFARQGSSAG